MLFHEPSQTLLDSKAKLKLLSHLFSQREVEMGERELARVLNLSNFSVNQLMKLFEQNNLVERRRVGAATVWRLKKGSYYFELLEPMFRRISTFPAPLEHLKNLVLSSYPLERVSRIYLYGSIAEGRENYNSDIDLFVVVKSGVDKEEIERANDKLRASCLALYGNTAQIIVMSESEYARKRGVPLVKQVERGLKLYPGEAQR
ncbi:MAG: nucleotidyltransferase domain-containing protein [Candidatus Hadarchaeaceae archaeon]